MTKDPQNESDKTVPPFSPTRYQSWLKSAMDRYRERNSKRITLRDIARFVGVDYTTLWKTARGNPEVYPNNIRPSFENARKIGQLLGDVQGSLVAAEYGSDPENPLSRIGKPFPIEFLGDIPMSQQPAGASPMRLRDREQLPILRLADALPQNVVAIQVEGDCMEPRFHEGDILIVRQTPAASPGDVVIALVNLSAITCKVYRESMGRGYLEPLNGEGRINDFQIVGVVTHSVRNEGRFRN
jgi:repressor LexA